jgi:hypothetical protein
VSRMNSQDISTMTALLKSLIEAQAAEAKAQTTLDTINLKRGQDGISCSVAGLTFGLSYSDSTTSYYPRYLPGRQALIAELRKVAHEHLIACRSKVEGIQFQIRKLAKTGGAS